MCQESTDLDRQLKQLEIDAQRHRSKSLERRLALNQLCAELLKPGCLTSYPVPSEFDRHEIYQEARSQMLLEVCQKIDNYNSENEVRQWRPSEALLQWQFCLNYAPGDRVPESDWKKKAQQRLEGDRELLRWEKWGKRSPFAR